jgi:hypothetical protein
MQHRHFFVDPRKVARDAVEDEAILIHLESGNYFSLRGSAAEIWGDIEGNLAEDQLVEALLRRYDAPRDVLVSAVGSFVELLLGEGLMTVSEAPAGASSGLERDASGELPPEAPKREFTAPTFEKFTDMADLLLLDPIHEVDPKRGWPAPLPGHD